MTRFLWTGKSEFCICGHHVTDHETLQWPISLTEHPIFICRGGNIRSCQCDEFRPYLIVVEDEGLVENKIQEVIKE